MLVLGGLISSSLAYSTLLETKGLFGNLANACFSLLGKGSRIEPLKRIALCSKLACSGKEILAAAEGRIGSPALAKFGTTLMH
jgi:hypothetical protein